MSALDETLDRIEADASVGLTDMLDELKTSLKHAEEYDVLACSGIDDLLAQVAQLRSELAFEVEARKKAIAERDAARAALRQIADYPKEPLWTDSRDDAADAMVDIAEQALRT